MSMIVEENLRSLEYDLLQFEIGDLTVDAIASGRLGGSCFILSKITSVKSKRKKVLYTAIAIIPVLEKACCCFHTFVTVV